jgi:hypothetical protein
MIGIALPYARVVLVWQISQKDLLETLYYAQVT